MKEVFNQKILDLMCPLVSMTMRCKKRREEDKVDKQEEDTHLRESTEVRMKKTAPVVEMH